MSATDRLRRASLPLRFAAAVSCALPALASGQPPAVTDADLERVRREQPIVSDDDIARAAARYGRIAPLATPASPAPPNLDAMPRPLHATPLDLGAVADGYGHQPLAPPALDQGPSLYLFVSLSMPEPSLRRYVDQAARAGANVVIRGMADGSLRTTAARLQDLIGRHPVSIQIDPRPFEMYGVNRVPTFVLTRTSADAGCGEPTCARDVAFVRVSGDVSLDYALMQMRTRAPQWERAASLYLRRMGREE